MRVAKDERADNHSALLSVSIRTYYIAYTWPLIDGWLCVCESEI